jgi:exosome complex component RRP42
LKLHHSFSAHKQQRTANIEPSYLSTMTTTTTTMTEAADQSSRIVSNIPTRVLPSLSIAEQYYILEGCRDNCRADGRSRVDLRPFSLLTTDPLVLSHGSSRILASNTEILCSIKAELVHPRPETPHQGVVEFHVDLGTNGDFRKRRLLEQQLQTSLTFLLQDTLVPLESLCVVPGHYAWRLHCDLLVLQLGGGSVVDVASRALRGALLQTKLPHVVPLGSSNKGEATVDLAVDGDMHKAHSIVGTTIPVIVSVAIAKCPPNSTPVLVLDATAHEELCASCIVRVAISPSGQVVAIQNASGSLPLGLLPQVTAAAVQASQHVFTVMKAAAQPTSAADKNSAYASTNVATTLLQPQFQIR